MIGARSLFAAAAVLGCLSLSLWVVAKPKPDPKTALKNPESKFWKEGGYHEFTCVYEHQAKVISGKWVFSLHMVNNTGKWIKKGVPLNWKVVRKGVGTVSTGFNHTFEMEPGETLGTQLDLPEAQKGVPDSEFYCTCTTGVQSPS